MYTNVIPVQTNSVFKPNILAVFFRQEGSMKDEVYNMTTYEVKELIKQLTEGLKGIQ